MVGRIVIVYHEPGDPRGVDMVEALASRIGQSLGVEAIAVPMKRVEEGEHGFRKGDLVVSLLPARGGHLYTVVEAAREVGALHFGPIPYNVIAQGLARRLSGCSRVSLVYWPAKRFVKEQREDLEAISMELSKLLGADVRLVEIDRVECSECMAATSLFPGRVSKAISKCGLAKSVGYLFEAIEELLPAWVESLYKSAQRVG